MMIMQKESGVRIDKKKKVPLDITDYLGTQFFQICAWNNWTISIGGLKVLAPKSSQLIIDLDHNRMVSLAIAS